MLKPWQRWLLTGLATLALLLVFAVYLNPHLGLELTSQIWAC
jgi:hypothetical protein